jgi:hypothetical protein
MNMGTENEERGKRTFVTGLNDLRGRAEGGVSLVDIQNTSTSSHERSMPTRDNQLASFQ